MARSFIFGPGQEYKTPQELAKARAVASAMLAGQRAPRDVGEGLNSIGQALLYRSLMGRADASEKAGQASAAAAFNPIAAALGRGPTFPQAPGSSSKVANALAGKKPDNPNVGSTIDFARAEAGSRTPGGALPGSFLASVDRTEGGGNYDTLFGHAQRDGGAFAGTRVSEMPISEVLAFADPRGPYAQSVKSKIGRVATPMGRHQIVGTTLRNAVQEMGIDPSTPFNRDTQDAIAAHLARNRIASAKTMDGKIAALRSEWEGFKNVPYSQMAQVVTDLENGGAGTPPAVAAIERQAPIQVASLDPSAGMASAVPPLPPEYARTGLSQEAWARMNAPDGVAPQAPVAGPAQMVNPPAPRPALQPVQMAQAVPDLSQIPVTAGGNAGVAQPGQGPSLQQLYEAAQNPWLNDTQRAIIGAEIERQQQAADPLRQLQLEKMRRDIAAPQKNWQKLDDNTLFEPSTGEIKQVGGGDNTGAFRFGGNSVEAQALNGLMDSGALTPDQAQQLAAGKTVTNPADGSIMFMTPQGIFGQPAQGGPPQPIGPARGGSQLFSPDALGGNAQAQTAQPGQRDGMIRLTDAKPEKPTLDERNAMTFADRLKEASAVVDQVEGAGKSTWAQSITDNDYIPDVLENMMVGEDFQKFAQARRNFINAVLRRESGAVISASEFADANKQYFPMPGDTKEVLEQKRRNRQTVLDGMVRAGGKTYSGGVGGSPGDAGTPDNAVDWRTYFRGQ